MTPSPATTDERGRSIAPGGPSIEDPRLRAWRAFLFAQAAVLRRLGEELEREAHISFAEYDALVQLAIPTDRRLRMSELADRLVISRSGVTRLVDRLEAQGLVRRSTCAPDGRGAYAVLTRGGLARLREALPVHLGHVEQHFLAHVTPAELEVIEGSMRRVAEATGRCLAQLDSGLLGRLDDDGFPEPEPEATGGREGSGSLDLRT